jgi:hypothetical protein
VTIIITRVGIDCGVNTITFVADCQWCSFCTLDQISTGTKLYCHSEQVDTGYMEKPITDCKFFKLRAIDLKEITGA